MSFSHKTKVEKFQENYSPVKWVVIDATGKTLGRLATKIAALLRGKHLPTYTPHVPHGYGVIVINAEKIHVTGKKLDQKVYYRHSGYPGGIKETKLKDMLKKHPEYPIYHAVKGMLPKNKLSRYLLKRLKIYAGPNHPHQAQKPEVMEV